MSVRWIAFRSAPLALLLLFADGVSAQGHTLLVTPAEVKLEGNFSRVQLVVTAADASGMVNERSEDLTGQAKFASSAVWGVMCLVIRQSADLSGRESTSVTSDANARRAASP